jgi:hypothetical protein
LGMVMVLEYVEEIGMAASFIGGMKGSAR